MEVPNALQDRARSRSVPFVGAAAPLPPGRPSGVLRSLREQTMAETPGDDRRGQAASRPEPCQSAAQAVRWRGLRGFLVESLVRPI